MKAYTLLGQRLTIEEVENLGVIGRSLLDNMMVQVDSRLCEGQKLSTILHEVIELISRMLDLGLEERQIRGIEVGMYQFLTENGIDVKVLLEDI